MSDSTQEPDALVAHVRICAGGARYAWLYGDPFQDGCCQSMNNLVVGGEEQRNRESARQNGISAVSFED